MSNEPNQTRTEAEIRRLRAIFPDPPEGMRWVHPADGKHTEADGDRFDCGHWVLAAASLQQEIEAKLCAACDAVGQVESGPCGSCRECRDPEGHHCTETTWQACKGCNGTGYGLAAASPPVDGLCHERPPKPEPPSDPQSGPVDPPVWCDRQRGHDGDHQHRTRWTHPGPRWAAASPPTDPKE